MERPDEYCHYRYVKQANVVVRPVGKDPNLKRTVQKFNCDDGDGVRDDYKKNWPEIAGENIVGERSFILSGANEFKNKEGGDENNGADIKAGKGHHPPLIGGKGGQERLGQELKRVNNRHEIPQYSQNQFTLHDYPIQSFANRITEIDFSIIYYQVPRELVQYVE